MNEYVGIKALIVDNEPLARKRIRNLLKAHPEFSVVGESSNGREALSSIRQLAPDLVFLDMQMPEVDGLSFIKSQAPGDIPLIIFVTAYDNYGLEAFDSHAVDYLLKPFDQQRFDEALQQVKARLTMNEGGAQETQLSALVNRLEIESKYLKQLSIRTDGRIFLVKVANIDWIEAERNYVRLHVRQESHLRRVAIRSMEAQLDLTKFRRIHRSTIVNMDSIKELRSAAGGDYQVVLRNGTELPLSRSYHRNIHEFLG